jgi:hypothetical protein
MSRYQFEADLTHLEQIIPLLLRGNPLSLPYWRGRVSSLSAQQSLLPDVNRRVTRLLQVFDEVERALISGKPAAGRSPGQDRRVRVPVAGPSKAHRAAAPSAGSA